MVVEAKQAVPWTKPDSDLPFDPAAALALRRRLVPSGRLQRPSCGRIGSVHQDHGQPGDFASLDHAQWGRSLRTAVNPSVKSTSTDGSIASLRPGSTRRTRDRAHDDRDTIVVLYTSGG